MVSSLNTAHLLEKLGAAAICSGRQRVWHGADFFPKNQRIRVRKVLTAWNRLHCAVPVHLRTPEKAAGLLLGICLHLSMDHSGEERWHPFHKPVCRVKRGPEVSPEHV